MKARTFILSVCLAALATGCSHEPSPIPENTVDNQVSLDDAEGLIIRNELTACWCCGGWYVLVDSTEYLMSDFPPDTDFDINQETLPFPVTISFDPDSTLCWQINRINVRSLLKR